MSLTSAVAGVDGSATVLLLTGGVDVESDNDLRSRILARIRTPPMGGAADDYVAWAREVPGVTRAWASPLEMGMGTVTVRFMMDVLRAGSGGFPNDSDVAAVQTHIDLRRPVAARDVFVRSPLPRPIDFSIAELAIDTASTRAAIGNSVAAMLRDRAAPARAVSGIRVEAQTIYAAWLSEAVTHTAGVERFRLVSDDHDMPSNGHMAVPGTITFA